MGSLMLPTLFVLACLVGGGGVFRLFFSCLQQVALTGFSELSLHVTSAVVVDSSGLWLLAISNLNF